VTNFVSDCLLLLYDLQQISTTLEGIQVHYACSTPGYVERDEVVFRYWPPVILRGDFTILKVPGMEGIAPKIACANNLLCCVWLWNLTNAYRLL